MAWTTWPTAVVGNPIKASDANTGRDDANWLRQITGNGDPADRQLLVGTGTATAAWQTTAQVAVNLNGVSPSINDNSWTLISWQLELYDTQDMWVNTSKPRFTIPTGHAGKYWFHAWLTWSTGQSGQRGIRLRRNGATVLRVNWDDCSSTAVSQTSELTYEADCAAADYFEIQAYQDNAGNVALGIDAAGENSGFQAARIA